MRQLSQSYKTGKLALVDLAKPRAPSGGVLVRTSASLISAGTERMIVELARKSLVEKAKERPDLVAKVFDKAKKEGILSTIDAVRNKLDTPIPLGYSMAGRIEEVGADVTGLHKGDRVACAGAGYANHAEYNAIPQNLVVPIPDGVSDEEASFATVGAIGLHGVRLAKPELGKVMVVIGLGLIGQMTVSFLAASGCLVIGVDIDPARIELAKTRGASFGASPTSDDVAEVVRAASNGFGADGVIITASSKDASPLALAGDIARDRAIVSIVGFMPLEIPRKAYFEKELQVVVSRSYGPGRYDVEYEERGHDYPIGYVRWTERRNLEAVLFAIQTKRLDVKSLITHRYDFSRALDAYALITGEKPEPHLGVVLGYGDSSEQSSASDVAPRPSLAPSDSVGIGIIGTGAFATSVLLPNLKTLPHVSIEAFVSGRGLSAEHARDRYGKGAVYGTMQEAAENPRTSAFIVATRHSSHASMAEKALQMGKHVFLEKPAAITLEQLESLKSTVESSDKILMVGFNRRFSPFARKVHSFFSGRRSGLLFSARINAGRIPKGSWLLEPEEGGGRVIGEVCHFIDLFSYWADSPVTDVSAHSIGPGGGYEREDNLVIGLSFADGSAGSILYTAMGDPSVSKERYEVIGEGKIAVIDNFRTLSLTQQGKTSTTRALRQEKGHREELEAFIHAIRSGLPSPIPWSSIEATTRATLAVETSQRQ